MIPLLSGVGKRQQNYTRSDQNSFYYRTLHLFIFGRVTDLVSKVAHPPPSPSTIPILYNYQAHRSHILLIKLLAQNHSFDLPEQYTVLIILFVSFPVKHAGLAYIKNMIFGFYCFFFKRLNFTLRNTNYSCIFINTKYD